MDLRSLRHFLAVADTLNFSRAAEKLHRTQPSLSRSIRELEAEFGVSLFDRTGRRVALRPEGELLLAQARYLVEDAERLRAKAQLLAKGRIYVMRLGAASNTLERVLPQVLRLYHKEWPTVELQLRSGGGSSLLAAVERNELDVAISRAANSDLLASKFAFPMHIVAVFEKEHRLADKRILQTKDLEGERLLVPPETFTSRMMLDDAFSAAEIRPNIALESHDINALVALAEAGLGVTVAPSTVSTGSRKVVVRAIQHDGHPLGCSTGFIWNRRRKLAPHILRFIEIAEAHFRHNYPGKELRLPPLKRGH
jgi:DNA-binding transcriptional LysR family regulator